jgi:hypothetical protein
MEIGHPGLGNFNASAAFGEDFKGKSVVYFQEAHPVLTHRNKRSPHAKDGNLGSKRGFSRKSDFGRKVDGDSLETAFFLIKMGLIETGIKRHFEKKLQGLLGIF